MARYRFSIDMGVFLGMRHITVDIDGKPISGIFIPTGVNGIDVSVDNRSKDKANQSGLRAFLNFQQRNYNAAYQSAVRDRLAQQGEVPTLYNVPAMQVCYTLPEERRKLIRASLKKKVLLEHPEWSAQEDIKGTDLAGAISRLMPFQMGDSYLMEDATANQQYGSAPVSQSVSGYTPVSNYGPTSEQEDLPF